MFFQFVDFDAVKFWSFTLFFRLRIDNSRFLRLASSHRAHQRAIVNTLVVLYRLRSEHVDIIIFLVKLLNVVNWWVFDARLKKLDLLIVLLRILDLVGLIQSHIELIVSHILHHTWVDEDLFMRLQPFLDTLIVCFAPEETKDSTLLILQLKVLSYLNLRYHLLELVSAVPFELIQNLLEYHAFTVQEEKEL